jgi:putative molybdopterin biosynthesis protein
MDFVPLFSELYQLVIPRQYYESALLAPLLDILRSPEFAAQVDALGGYDVANMGQVVYQSP